MHARWTILMLVGVAMIGSASCRKVGDEGSPAGPTPPVANASIVVPRGDIYGVTNYTPANVTVVVGGSVTWRNNDTVDHTSVANNSSWKGLLGPGGEYTRTFQTAGTFPFYCELHDTMKGTVIVQ